MATYFTDTFTIGVDTSLVTYDASYSVYEGASATVKTATGAVTQGSGVDTVRCIHKGYTTPTDQYAEITAKSVNNDLIGPIVRFTDAGSSNYRYYTITADANTVYLYWVGDGSYGQIASYSTTNTVGTVLRLEVTGTSFNCLRNGSSLGTTSDSHYSTGQPGFTVQAYYLGKQSDASVDSFNYGDMLTKRKILVT